MSTNSEVEIKSRDYWFKIVDFLQQNWALVDGIDQGAVAWFFSDTSGVFDKLTFPTLSEATNALLRNGFRRYAADQKAQACIALPQPPFHYQTHPNGPIYSSGRYWK